MAVLHADGGAVGQIGDGAVVAQEGEGVWQPLLWPDHGEYVNTTRFLTDADALAPSARSSSSLPALSSVCLFSDGLERLVLDLRARTAHAPFFDAVFKRFGGEPQPGHAAQVSRELRELLDSDSGQPPYRRRQVDLCATLLLGPSNGAGRSA